jgi:hypothetical protein
VHYVLVPPLRDWFAECLPAQPVWTERVARTRSLADEIVQPKHFAKFSSAQNEQPCGLRLLPIPHALLA